MTTGTNDYQTQGEAPDRIRPAFGWMELAEAGKYQEALACIEQHLCAAPHDAQALNDAGAVLHCLGRSDEAINHLVKARNLSRTNCSAELALPMYIGTHLSQDPQSPVQLVRDAEIVWNLVEAYLADGRADEATQLFDDMERMGIFNVDVLNRTANVFLNQDNKADAIDMLLRSLQLAPEQEILRPMIDVIRSKRPKIAFFCGNDGMTFLDEIVEFTKLRFQVRLFEGQTKEQLYEMMEWSDISWFEWCTDLAMMASKMPKVCKNIIRLHRYEAYLHWPQQINWDNIDLLITVGNSWVRDTLVNKVSDIESKTKLITVTNGVNLEKLPFTNRSRGKNIAFLSNLRMVKNPAFILQCMQKLKYIDSEYRLFFAGSFQDQTLEQYLRHMVDALGLDDVVFFDGWQENVSGWLADKHYIVSTSIIESQGMGLLEGMACGLKPVIHNFPGASQIYPKEFLFNISEEFCEQILSDKYEPERYRKFVEENYSLKEQLSKTNRIFTQFEAEIDLQRIDKQIVFKQS